MKHKKFQTKKISRGTNKKEYVVLHHTGNGLNFDNEVNYLCYSKGQVSCHYIVGQAGEVAQIAKDDQITWHAGYSEREGKRDINYCSIGIEVVSDGKIFTRMQYDAVNEIVRKLMKEYNIPAHKIITHKNISGYRGKRDIGDNFWNRFHKTYQDYQKYLSDHFKIMQFYEKLRRDNYSTIPTKRRFFKDPESFLDKTKDLSIEEKLSELVFLIAILAEKTGKKFEDLPDELAKNVLQPKTI